MAKYVRSLDPKRNPSIKKNRSVKSLTHQAICRCKEAVEGEHECPAVEARELLDKLLNKH